MAFSSSDLQRLATITLPQRLHLHALQRFRTMGLFSSKPVNAAASGHLAIYGYEGCSYHYRAIQRANETAAATGGKLTVESQTWPRPQFKQWAAAESQKLGVRHSTSPFVTLDGKFLGGCDDTLAWLDSAGR